MNAHLAKPTQWTAVYELRDENDQIIKAEHTVKVHAITKLGAQARAVEQMLITMPNLAEARCLRMEHS